MDGRLWLWTIDGTVLLEDFIISNQFMKERIAFDRKDDIMYVVSRHNNSVLAYDINKKKFLKKYQSLTENITSIVISESNELIAFSDTGKILKPKNSGSELIPISIREKNMNIMSAITKGDFLYVCNDEGQVLMLSMEGKVVDKVEVADIMFNVQSIDISNTQAFLAVAGNNGNIKVYSDKRHLLNTVPVRADYCMDVKFLHLSDAFISSSDDQRIRVWNIQGQELASYATGAMSIIYAIDISSDDRNMITADDRNVLFWRLRKPIEQFFNCELLAE